MIWALLEDLLLVQLGLVVGRVALVEVGHFVFYVSRRRVDGVPGPRLAGPRRALRCSELLAADSQEGQRWGAGLQPTIASVSIGPRR